MRFRNQRIAIGLLATITPMLGGCGEDFSPIPSRIDFAPARPPENDIAAAMVVGKDEIDKNLPPGFHEQVLKQEDGRPLRFTIVIPEGYSPEKPAPLILSLHYAGDVSPFYGKDLVEIVVEPALRELQAIIVAPDAVAPGWEDPRNEKNLLRVLDQVNAGYTIDPKKTLVTGYSMGGMGAWFYASKYPERFSAAIPIAGRPPEDVKEWKTPTHAIHSRRDEIIHYRPTERFVADWKAKGAPVQLKLIENYSHYETSRFREPLEDLKPWIRSVWNSP